MADARSKQVKQEVHAHLTGGNPLCVFWRRIWTK